METFEFRFDFEKIIYVSGRPILFCFSMSNAVLAEYIVRTSDRTSEFIMFNCVKNGYYLQFRDENQLPQSLKSEKNIHKKLNDAMIETWPKTSMSL